MIIGPAGLISWDYTTNAGMRQPVRLLPSSNELTHQLNPSITADEYNMPIENLPTARRFPCSMYGRTVGEEKKHCLRATGPGHTKTATEELREARRLTPKF